MGFAPLQTDHDALDNVSTSDHHTKTQNVPNWQEDGNSPFTGSGSQSHTYTLAGTFDHVKVIVESLQNDSGGSQDMEMLMNGLTSGYVYVNNADTRTTAASQLVLVGGYTDTGILSGELYIQGASSTDRLGVFNGLADEQASTGSMVRGRNSSLASPLDSFTFEGSAGNISVRARVYGLDT